MASGFKTIGGHAHSHVNGGLRWDYDSAFQKADNISPRIGFAWSVSPKTVVRVASASSMTTSASVSFATSLVSAARIFVKINRCHFPACFPEYPHRTGPVWLVLSQTETDAQLLTQPDFCIPPNALAGVTRRARTVWD